MHPRAPDLKVFLVGGGIASLAAAVYLVRDGRVPGENIRILEESTRLGGSLDAGGSPEQGYSMRGTRMFGAAYVLMQQLLASIPSVDDPARSVAQDMFEFCEQAPWDATARLVEKGAIVNAAELGLSNKDRVDLIGFLLRPEQDLGAKRIDECFDPHFLATNFWFLWRSMFGFEPWHSAAELRRYLLRFLRLFPDLPRLTTIASTRYNGYDSIVRPIARWLTRQGVRFETGVRVTDLDFAPAPGGKAVRRIACLRDGTESVIDVAAGDLVIVTLGSMTADSSLGSMSAAPVPNARRMDGSWALWERLAGKDPAFGRPAAFSGDVDRTKWITFTVTHPDDRFFQRVERFSGRPAGQGGLVTLKDSSWGLTFHLFHSPAYADQSDRAFVWWGYGLFAGSVGDFVKKRMSECSGSEILDEVISHLGWQDDLPVLTAGANCVPCLLPYATSQFMPRAQGDRPSVVPEGSVNLAFVGQYCEIPDNVVFTVEYSIHSALVAVATLLGFPQAIPPTYKGLDHPNALAGAMRVILH